MPDTNLNSYFIDLSVNDRQKYVDALLSDEARQYFMQAFQTQDEADVTADKLDKAVGLWKQILSHQAE